MGQIGQVCAFKNGNIRVPQLYFKMERLIELIKLIDDSSEIVVVEYLGETTHEYVNEVRSLLDHLFIDDDGHCNWENFKIANANNIYPFAIEQDRFGWLIGAIETKKGLITYG